MEIKLFSETIQEECARWGCSEFDLGNMRDHQFLNKNFAFPEDLSVIEARLLTCMHASAYSPTDAILISSAHDLTFWAGYDYRTILDGLVARHPDKFAWGEDEGVNESMAPWQAGRYYHKVGVIIYDAFEIHEEKHPQNVLCDWTAPNELKYYHISPLEEHVKFLTEQRRIDKLKSSFFGRMQLRWEKMFDWMCENPAWTVYIAILLFCIGKLFYTIFFWKPE